MATREDLDRLSGEQLHDLAVRRAFKHLDVKFFSTLTSLGVPYDITLHELRVECFFPADAASEARLRALAGPG